MNVFTSVIADASWAVWMIVLPLASATAALILGRRVAWLGVVASLGVGVAAIGLTCQVWQLGPQRYSVGGWGVPLGIDLYADGLSVLMLLMTAVIGLSVSIYATSYFVQPHATDRTASDTAALDYFWPLWLFLWGALNALFLSADIFNLYVTLELVTLSSVALVALAGTPSAVSAALRYLLAALLGSLVYLLGVAVLYASYSTLDIASLAGALVPTRLTAAAVALVTAGLVLKGALFPLHFWLPQAHASAPAPVSAVLSALVVKASFYLLLRLWFDAFPAVVAPNAALVLGILGSGAIVWGSLQALAAPGLKSLVAYSTVAQLGYLFLVFALAIPGERSTAWSGGILFAVSHACAKASMFLAVGNVVRMAGHDRIAELDRIGRRLPVTFFSMALASVTLMGLPPSGAFVAKWMLLAAALGGGRAWFAAVILAGGLLAAWYLFGILRQAFAPSETDSILPVPRAMDWPPLGLAVLALSLGLFAAPILHLLQIGGSPAGNAVLQTVP
jgi:multicomponent Na+:H+ antiporter subunit D